MTNATSIKRVGSKERVENDDTIKERASRATSIKIAVKAGSKESVRSSR